MPFLTIGATTVEVLTEGASENEPERGGELARAFSGNLRSTLRYRKRKFQFSTGLITEASYLALVAAVDTGTAHSCSGDALNNVAGNFVVQLSDGIYVRDITDPLDFKRSATLVLTEE